MSTALAVIGIVAASVALSGCTVQNTQPATEEDRSYEYIWIDAPEEIGGGQVLCVFIGSAHGGPSCDWVLYHETHQR